MRLFPLHIFIKDLSFLSIYLVLMKYDLTNETFLPETIREFPGASRSKFGDIFLTVLIYNWIPILVSFLLYYPIVLFGRFIIKNKNKPQTFVISFLLFLTTPLIYIFGYKIGIESMKKAEIIAWISTFVISMSVYYILNRKKYNKT